VIVYELEVAALLYRIVQKYKNNLTNKPTPIKTVLSLRNVRKIDYELPVQKLTVYYFGTIAPEVVKSLTAFFVSSSRKLPGKHLPLLLRRAGAKPRPAMSDVLYAFALLIDHQLDPNDMTTILSYFIYRHYPYQTLMLAAIVLKVFVVTATVWR